VALHLNNMTKIEHDNFVGIYDGFFSDEFCDNLIKHFDWCAANNKAWGRSEQESVKKDNSICLNPVNVQEISFSHPNIACFIGEFNSVFWETCYKNYLEIYSVLSEYSKHTIYTYKIQKTEPAGGYHIWHCEDAEVNFARRVGVYILYLNDVEEGGETEFLYLSKRIKPKKGRLILFPPNFPWAHRGNPPLTGSKYIMTGWMEFQ
jgi:hypothetical protein